MRLNRQRLHTAASLVGVVIAFALVMSCATTPPHQQEHIYNNVREIWNAGAQQFIIDFKMAPAETKTKWADEVIPVLLEAERALDAWGMAIDAGASDGAQYRAFIQIKNQLLLVANRYGKWFDELEGY